MGDQVLITLCGHSEWATLNSLWAVIKHTDYIPDKVYIFSFPEDINKANGFKDSIKVLLAEYGIETTPTTIKVPDDSIEKITQKFKEIIDREKESGNDLSLDLSNGRKLMALSALKAYPIQEYKHVFELYIKTLEDVNYPYMCIPMSLQKLYDFREGS